MPIVTTPRLAPTDASRRWAALRQQIFEVDPLACPQCAGPMRIVAFITQSAVIDQILTHLRTHATSEARRRTRTRCRSPRRTPTWRCPNASATLFTAAKISHLGALPQGQPERKRRAKAMVERMDLEGFGGCTLFGECQEACPKGISLDAIMQMNRDFVVASVLADAL